jgi:hypothetical protein
MDQVLRVCAVENEVNQKLLGPLSEWHFKIFKLSVGNQNSKLQEYQSEGLNHSWDQHDETF